MLTLGPWAGRVRCKPQLALKRQEDPYYGAEQALPLARPGPAGRQRSTACTGALAPALGASAHGAAPASPLDSWGRDARQCRGRRPASGAARLCSAVAVGGRGAHKARTAPRISRMRVPHYWGGEDSCSLRGAGSKRGPMRGGTLGIASERCEYKHLFMLASLSASAGRKAAGHTEGARVEVRDCGPWQHRPARPAAPHMPAATVGMRARKVRAAGVQVLLANVLDALKRPNQGADPSCLAQVR